MTSILRLRVCAFACVKRLSIPVALIAGMAVAQGCGTMSKVTGAKEDGASTDKDARYVKPDDPLARPIQVAWTAARAQYCGFMFDAAKLKSDYLADESRRGADQDQMQKALKAYDYTYESVSDTISEDASYCNKERLDAIRKDLRRYLSGDYAPVARMAR